MLADMADILEVLNITSEYEACSQIWWRTDGQYAPVTFLINCNDFFFPAADAEEITKENIPLLRKTFQECQALDDSDTREIGVKEYAISRADQLFVARVRKTRPWKRKFDKYVPEKMKPLFLAAGESGYGW